MQRYSRLNTGNHMLSEEKEQKRINTNAITRYNAIVLSCDQQLNPWCDHRFPFRPYIS